MMKTQIGLGVLAIPSALDTLGMVPGIISLIVVACITTWAAYIIGTFKLQHREVYSIDDAGGIMFGVVGRGILSAGFCLCMFPDRKFLANRSKKLQAVTNPLQTTSLPVAQLYLDSLSA